MNWTRLTRAAASQRFRELHETRELYLDVLSQEDRSLRGHLKDSIPAYRTWTASTISYDIEVGLSLHRILQEHGFGLRTAADDGFWRYLSLAVLPDIVLGRWNDAPEDRFWRMRSRIWLRAMWWFVYLAWQGSESATRAALQGMTTDDVVQLVERPGQGFRIDLCRALIRAAGKRQLSSRKFRQLMKLNTANLVMIEPSIYPAGVDGYVERLYASLETLEQHAAAQEGM